MGDHDDASLDLLAHFDRRVTAGRVPPVPKRGVGWVLRWSAAIAALLIAGVPLATFSFCLAAERDLARAARAGAAEASLPRATTQSVVQSIERRLEGYARDRVRFSLQQNGAPVRGAFQVSDGDRLSVTLAVSTHDVLPRWLRSVALWQAESQIVVQAERRLPGRELVRR
jgi:hypothetical protein